MGGRLTRRIASVAALSAVCAGAALAAPSSAVPTVKVSSSALGTDVLVSSKGLTLYHYVPDRKGTVKCTGSCAVLFPPLVVATGTKPVAGPGLAAAKLGTIKRPDGRLQVTYNGLTLYRDYYDTSAGAANGQGQGGTWYAVTAAGAVTKVRPTPAAPAASATSQPTVPAPAPGASNFPQAAGPPPDCVDSDC